MEKYPESHCSLKYLCCHINILAHTTSPGLTYRQPLVFFIRRGGTIYILLDFIFKKKKKYAGERASLHVSLFSTFLFSGKVRRLKFTC